MALLPSPVGSEVLDDPATDPALVTRMLADIAVANRFFGGVATARRGLAQLIGPADRDSSLSLLDIGTGAGDLPRALAKWAARRGVILRTMGLERSRPAAQLARQQGLPTMVACAGSLPLTRGSVDLILLSQLLHHLDDDSAVHVLAECANVARRGVIVADLTPSRWAATAFRLAGRGLGFHPMTLLDGVTSLARGRRPAHLTALARRAGASTSHAESRAFARVVLTWRTGA